MHHAGVAGGRRPPASKLVSPFCQSGGDARNRPYGPRHRDTIKCDEVKCRNPIVNSRIKEALLKRSPNMFPPIQGRHVRECHTRDRTGRIVLHDVTDTSTGKLLYRDSPDDIVDPAPGTEPFPIHYQPAPAPVKTDVVVTSHREPEIRVDADPSRSGRVVDEAVDARRKMARDGVNANTGANWKDKYTVQARQPRPTRSRAVKGGYGRETGYGRSVAMLAVSAILAACHR